MGSNMRSDVSDSILRKTALDYPYNVQLVYVESYVTNLSLPTIGNLHGPPTHLPILSAQLSIMML
jgi:hypothetical protein